MPQQSGMPKGNLSALRQRVLGGEKPTLKEERLYVPEWECEVIIREMTAKARAQFIQSVTDPKTGARILERFYPDLVILSVIDPETGERVFEPADRDALNSGSGNALERIAQVAVRVSALTEDELKATAAK